MPEPPTIPFHLKGGKTILYGQLLALLRAKIMCHKPFSINSTGLYLQEIVLHDTQCT